MEIKYIEGDSIAFVKFIKDQEDRAELRGIDGHMRWVVTGEDGVQYIARPSEAHE